MSAKIHTQASNRATKANKQRRKGKEGLRDAPSGQDDRKVVFKSVLDNPLTLDWPHIPLNVQNNLLAALIELIAQSDISSFHRQRERASRKKKTKKPVDPSASHSTLPVSEPTSVVAGKRKAPEGGSDASTTLSKRRKLINGNAGATNHPLDPQIPPPELLSHITFGINQVTKRLEAQTLAYRHSKPPSSPPTTKAKELSPIHLVFVCRHDVDPPSLHAHLPMLVAACNASRPASSASLSHPDSDQTKQEDPDILLVTLPKGAEHALAESIALRRTAVLALDASTPNTSRLLSFLCSVPILRAPWLIPLSLPIITQSPSGSLPAAIPEYSASSTQSHHPPLIQTRIKHLRTSAPADMRLAKERRIQARAEAATMAKAKSQNHSGAKSNLNGKRKEVARPNDRTDNADEDEGDGARMSGGTVSKSIGQQRKDGKGKATGTPKGKEKGNGSIPRPG